MKAKMMGNTKDDPIQEVEVLPIGTPVRLKRDPRVIGRIRAHEYHESGFLSPIPYSVEWDDPDLAREVRGWLFTYATDDQVEPIHQSEQR